MRILLTTLLDNLARLTTHINSNVEGGIKVVYILSAKNLKWEIVCIKIRQRPRLQRVGLWKVLGFQFNYNKASVSVDAESAP